VSESLLMQVSVNFYSYLKDLTGCAQLEETMPEGSTLQDCFNVVSARFPKLKSMERSILMAVGLDYRQRGYLLKQGDEVSFFPPVQGG
jgi:molybdopterin converting factor small subunit